MAFSLSSFNSPAEATNILTVDIRLRLYYKNTIFMINHCTMKNNSIIAGIILFIVFLIVGYNTFSFFIHFTLRNMGADQFLAATPNESLSHRLVYSITLALIPLTIVTNW